MNSGEHFSGPLAAQEDRAEGSVPITVVRSFSGYHATRQHLSDLEAGNVPPKDKPSALHYGLLNVLANNFKELCDAYDVLYNLFTTAIQERGKFASLYAKEGHRVVVLTEELDRERASGEAKLEQSEHNCDILLRYIDQALRDARQLKASLDDWAVSETDADAHRLRSTRAYQIVKGLETASHSLREEVMADLKGATGATSVSDPLNVLDNLDDKGRV